MLNSLNIQVTKTMLGKFLVIFLILILKVNSQSEECQEICKQVGYLSCKICYKKCKEQNKYQFEIQTCQKPECERYVIDSKESFSQPCEQYSMKMLSQDQCGRTCCGLKDYQEYSSKKIETCVQPTIQDDILDPFNGIIIGVAVGFVIIIFFILIFISAYCKQHRIPRRVNLWFIECFQSTKRMFTKHRIHSQVNQNSISQIQESRNIVISNQNKRKKNVYVDGNLSLLWKPDQKSIQKDQCDSQQQRCCSICIEVSTNCQTQCGHKFHAMCFKKWIDRNPACPLCMNIHFNPIKIYCQLCRKKYAYYYMQKKVQIKRSPSFLNGKNIICNDCAPKSQIQSELHINN